MFQSPVKAIRELQMSPAPRRSAKCERVIVNGDMIVIALAGGRWTCVCHYLHHFNRHTTRLVSQGYTHMKLLRALVGLGIINDTDYQKHMESHRRAIARDNRKQQIGRLKFLAKKHGFTIKKKVSAR